jgi:RNA polymerase sigma factor FliA
MATTYLSPSTGSFVSRSDLRIHRRTPPVSGKIQKSLTPDKRSHYECPDQNRGAEVNREQMVVELFPLVRKVALKMHRRLPAHVEVDDLVGEGALGLLDAVRKFDPRKRVKFESYARHRIRGAILDGLRTLDPASRDLRKKNKKVEKECRELQLKLGRAAGDEELAGALGVSLGGWHRVIQELQTTGVDWLRPMQFIGPKQISEEALVDEKQRNQFDLCYCEERRAIMNRALLFLPERDRQIVFFYYTKEMTMKDIGRKLRVDESRVSQLHSAALVRLRSSVRAILEGTRTKPPLSQRGVMGDLSRFASTQRVV